MFNEGSRHCVRRSVDFAPTRLATASAIALGMALPAAAQEAEGPASAAVEEVVVTGSRLGISGFTAPTPVTSMSSEQIQKRAPGTIADVLNQIPSFQATNTPNTSGVTSRTGGVVTANLRNLNSNNATGATRTLVLVDGRRFVPSDTNGIVDLKQIPTLLIDRVEVVTGGASAAWGSDAVAGVVNLILKRNLEGVQGAVQYGQSEVGDNEETRVSLAGGH